MSRAVILLKAPPRDLADDAYVRQFLSSGYKVYFVKVLESVFSNENQLYDTIRSDPEGYIGVVMTSTRASEAWIHALRYMDNPGNWTDIPFYVVGQATAHSLRQASASRPKHISDKLIMGAAQSGKSESLAQFVLTDLATRNGSGKLLYLTGDKNRDVFTNVMSENGIDVEELCVYETMAASALEDDIDGVAKAIEHKNHATRTWIVFFAPSSSDIAIPHLRRHFQWSDVAGSSGDVGMAAKFAAIGPTTATFLRSERHLKVDAVALKPTPEQLVQAILDVDVQKDPP